MRRLYLLLLLLTVTPLQPAAAGERTLQAGGVSRTYRVYRPANLAAPAKMPLVVILHGGLGTGLDAESRYGWDAAADRYGFMVAYPDGVKRTWNAGACCGPAQREEVDDVGFLNQLLRVLTDEGADPRKIYLTGMSNGGAMAYRYACEGKVPVAAIGIVSGALTVSCRNPQKISLIAVHGSTDQHIPIDGGMGKKGLVKLDWPSYNSTLDLFRSALNCASPQTRRDSSVTIKTASCVQNAVVIQITIDGAGHQWPGSKPNDRPAARLFAPDPPSKALDATQVLSEFFLAHPRS
jgi:polyhydroxybutyrate depolymerase